jgi:Icc-related predicted phosphoesterase
MHGGVKVPDGDVLIHAGDFVGKGDLSDYLKFAEWIKKLPHKHKVISPGNHEVLLERCPHTIKSIFSEVSLLIDEMISIEGLNIFCSPWQPEFCDWAFNVQRGAKIKRKWDRIPEHTDVLVTHGPPHGILDHLNYKNLGCEELLKAVFRVKPMLHCFGHIHNAYGICSQNGTTFVNGSICTEQYDPVRIPIVVELERTNDENPKWFCK